VLAAPPVRRLARDLGVDLSGVLPTGPAGTIVRADVTAAAAPAAAVAAPSTVARPATGASSAHPGQRIAVRGVARQMALAMERSAFTVPQATVARDIDVSDLLALLRRWKAKADDGGTRVTPLAFIARAIVAAAGRHPLANARWLAAPDGTAEIEVYGEVNLGVAVASERGLVVPVIPGAGRLALPAFAGELTDLVDAARSGRTEPARMRGATITVSNIGVFGIDTAIGLVREGECALVVLGAIRDTPAVVDGQVAVRQVMTVSVSFDHRILDGAAAARFLAEIASILTDPASLLLAG
jgi:pyruvate dehydrogenase E2 component (dihydrolipoamide acetyltransferase)